MCEATSSVHGKEESTGFPLFPGNDAGSGSGEELHGLATDGTTRDENCDTSHDVEQTGIEAVPATEDDIDQVEKDTNGIPDEVDDTGAASAASGEPGLNAATESVVGEAENSVEHIEVRCPRTTRPKTLTVRFGTNRPPTVVKYCISFKRAVPTLPDAASSVQNFPGCCQILHPATIELSRPRQGAIPFETTSAQFVRNDIQFEASLPTSLYFPLV